MTMPPMALRILSNCVEGTLVFTTFFVEAADRQKQFLQDLKLVFDRPTLERILKIFNQHLDKYKSTFPAYDPVEIPYNIGGSNGKEFISVIKQLDRFHYRMLSTCYAYNELYIKREEALTPAYQNFLLSKQIEYIYDCFYELVTFPGFPGITENELESIIESLKNAFDEKREELEIKKSQSRPDSGPDADQAEEGPQGSQGEDQAEPGQDPENKTRIKRG